MTTIDPKFGQEMRRLREAKGISQRKLGEMVGLASGYISRIERAEFKPPSEEKIVAMAEILGTNKDSLLALSGKVSSDVLDAVKSNPLNMPEIIRRVEGWGEYSNLMMLSVKMFEIMLSINEKPTEELDIETLLVGQEMYEAVVKLIPPSEQLEVISFLRGLLDMWEGQLKQPDE